MQVFPKLLPTMCCDDRTKHTCSPLWRKQSRKAFAVEWWDLGGRRTDCLSRSDAGGAVWDGPPFETGLLDHGKPLDYGDEPPRQLVDLQDKFWSTWEVRSWQEMRRRRSLAWWLWGWGAKKQPAVIFFSSCFSPRQDAKCLGSRIPFGREMVWRLTIPSWSRRPPATFSLSTNSSPASVPLDRCR